MGGRGGVATSGAGLGADAATSSGAVPASPALYARRGTVAAPEAVVPMAALSAAGLALVPAR